MALLDPWANVRRPGDTWLGEVADTDAPGGGTGRLPSWWPAANVPQSTTPGPVVKGRPMPRSVFDNRRGLLLTPEQLAGPPAPTYLLRRPYVYGRQNLL